MWRTRAVVSMLIEDVAGLSLPTPESGEEDELSEHPETETLSRAMSRARMVVAVDCLAILILFLFRDHTRPFTFGVLAVAAHAGFRWAQLERLRTVQRLCDDLRQRQDS